MTKQINADTPFLDQFPDIIQKLPGSGLPWLNGLRRANLDRYAALGLPSHEVEDWKYTSLVRLGRLGFKPEQPPTADIGAYSLPPLLAGNADSHRLVFVDGAFQPGLSAIRNMPDGISLGSLADQLATANDDVEQLLNRFDSDEGQAMLALNAAYMSDGMVLRLATGAVLHTPIELLFLNSANDTMTICHPRNLIVADAGSQATIIERHVGLGAGSYMVNGATDIHIEDGAVLRHYKLQEEGSEGYHLFNTRARLGRDAVYDSFVLSLGARLARNEIGVRLDGPGADCQLNGAYAGRANQHVDNTTFVDHASPKAASRQAYKGVLDDRSRGVFQGRILVRHKAQQSDGRQINKTLLLSDKAEIDCKPQLEIYADDVKCSHGATVGELEADAVFYLRARGIPEREARNLLVKAFLDEVIDGIASEAVRNAFHGKVSNWLAAA